jgi:hypothetical protein
LTELTITKNALAWLAVAGYVMYLVSANKVSRKNSTEDKTIERETERFFFPVSVAFSYVLWLAQLPCNLNESGITALQFWYRRRQCSARVC